MHGNAKPVSSLGYDSFLPNEEYLVLIITTAVKTSNSIHFIINQPPNLLMLNDIDIDSNIK
jgi:hypothetical protein